MLGVEFLMQICHVVGIFIGCGLIGCVVYDIVPELEHLGQFVEIILEGWSSEVLHFDERPFIEGTVPGQGTPKVNQHMTIYKYYKLLLIHLLKEIIKKYLLLLFFHPFIFDEKRVIQTWLMNVNKIYIRDPPIRIQDNFIVSSMSQNFKYLSSSRPTSPKFSSATTISASITDNSPKQKHKQIKKIGTFDTDQFSFVHKQNSRLREENRALRRQLIQIKGEQFSQRDVETSLDKSAEVNDLRDTIKKEAGQIKDLKTRLEMLSRQCKMYEEVIEKMELKINKLTQQNKVFQKLNSSPKSYNNLRKTLQQKPTQDINLICVKQRVDQISLAYQKLEERFFAEEQEWEMWKQQWSLQKTYYLHRINDLEKMLGIGVGEAEKGQRNGSKDFFKKRF